MNKFSISLDIIKYLNLSSGLVCDELTWVLALFLEYSKTHIPTKDKIEQCHIRPARWPRNCTTPISPSSRKCGSKNWHAIHEIQQCTTWLENYCDYSWHWVEERNGIIFIIPPIYLEIESLQSHHYFKINCIK
jgi:hypothetical protein